MHALRIILGGPGVSLQACRPGLFLFDDTIGFKSEYFVHDPERLEVYCLESGEIFWGGTSHYKERSELRVQPIELEWFKS